MRPTPKIILRKTNRKIPRTKRILKDPEDIYTPDTDLSSLPPYRLYTPLNYKDGPEGFISWCEHNVCIPIYPEHGDVSQWCLVGKLPSKPNDKTGRSYQEFWEKQKGVVRQALRMVKGRFVYKLIILCWMRGEGKSLLACLIQLWKFFNWPRQQIVLGANSRDQVTFVHFDIMRDIILYSPKLLRIVGKRNIQEKQIRIKDEKGFVVSVIRAISSFSGIVSNITGYTFSEMFDMKKPNFFVQLDGSTRNVPNSLGVIDSTVSSKSHVLYSLFQSYIKKETKTCFFSYRGSRKGESTDFWNPNMDQTQLDDYRVKFPLGEFEKYFKNLWSSGADKLFTEEMMDGMNYIGAEGTVGNYGRVAELLKKRKQLNDTIERLIAVEEELKGRKSYDLKNNYGWVEEVNKKLIPLTDYYSLKTVHGLPEMATVGELSQLGDVFDTGWAVIGGLDRADPLKGSRLGARTVFVCMAKGLPGSRSNPFLYDQQSAVPNYIYFLLHLAVISTHRIEDIKEVILTCRDEYDGIDMLAGERWGIWDMLDWCEEQDIPIQVYFPTYDRQKAAFTELYLAVDKGRFKSPPLAIWGSKGEDILREEALIFHHDPDKHWFGSVEKMERHGIQDDVMFSVAWGMFGGKELGINNFRERKGKMWFGSMVENRAVLGNYG